MEGHNSATNGQRYIYKGQEYIIIESCWWRATGLELYEMRRLVPASLQIEVGETVEVKPMVIISRLAPTPVPDPTTTTAPTEPTPYVLVPESTPEVPTLIVDAIEPPMKPKRKRGAAG